MSPRKLSAWPCEPEPSDVLHLGTRVHEEVAVNLVNVEQLPVDIPLDQAQLAVEFAKVSGATGAGAADQAAAAALLAPFVTAAGGAENRATASTALRSFLAQSSCFITFI